jgi:hypothetical protein
MLTKLQTRTAETRAQYPRRHIVGIAENRMLDGGYDPLDFLYIHG